MNILLAADIFPPESGGPATYVVTLARELVERGDTVTVVSLNPNSDKNVLDKRVNLFSVRFKNKILRYKHYLWLLFKHAKNKDVMYAMGPVNAGFLAYVIARYLRHKKLIVKVVGDYAWEQARVKGLTTDSIDDFQKKKYAGKINWLQKIERRVVQAADAVITPSNYLKNIVVGWGASENKTHVVYNAVELPSDIPVIHHPSEQWIVTVARLTPWKGVRALIMAVLELKKTMPHVKLKIVGDGPEKSALQSLVVEAEAGEMVEFLGNVPRTQGLSYIQTANVFVLNSGYEGFSHVILEAQALGVPVLTSRVGGNPELVPNEHLFAFNDREEIKKKIEEVLKSPFQTTGQPAEIMQIDHKQPHFTSFTFETMVQDTKKIMEQICGK